MERTCETCRHHLGGGYNNCRINLEPECAAGDFEAWEPVQGNREPVGTPCMASESPAPQAPAEFTTPPTCFRPLVRLLTATEFAAIEAGTGWLENMYDDGAIELERIAWAGGNTVTEAGNSTVSRLLELYGRPYGVRVWIGMAPPTDEQREVTPWR